MRIILLGAPGAGKGTQAENISKRLSIPIISTGNILREAIADNTVLGKKAKIFIDEGALVPDDLIISILKERLMQSDCDDGFVLDGVPRTIAQADALTEMDIEPDRVISIEIDDETVVRRLAGRRICLDCGLTYHIDDKPPKKDELCDTCGKELHIREDDVVDTIRNRLAVFHEQTEPLKQYYKKLGKLRMVYSQELVEDTTRNTYAALEA